MMGIIVPETCWAYHKCNKTISNIYLVFVLPLSGRWGRVLAKYCQWLRTWQSLILYSAYLFANWSKCWAHFTSAALTHILMHFLKRWASWIVGVFIYWEWSLCLQRHCHSYMKLAAFTIYIQVLDVWSFDFSIPQKMLCVVFMHRVTFFVTN